MARKSIVTRKGDGGETSLLYGGRVRKTDPRTEAYGAVDETISALGLARAHLRHEQSRAIVVRLQRELFTVGAELATEPHEYEKLKQHFKTVTPDDTARLEHDIDQLEARVPLPEAFVIPGGTVAAAALDVARTVARRAERRIAGLNDADLLANPEVLRYVNRLSDLLFMLARAEEGSAVIPVTGRRSVRRPPARRRTPPAPRGRPRG